MSFSLRPPTANTPRPLSPFFPLRIVSASLFIVSPRTTTSSSSGLLDAIFMITKVYLNYRKLRYRIERYIIGQYSEARIDFIFHKHFSKTFDLPEYLSHDLY